MSALSRCGTWALAFVASVVLFSAPQARAEFQVPRLSGPVVDEAGVVDAAAAQELDSVLRAIHEKGGPQINVLVVQSLEGLPIEMASIKVTDAWKLGDQKRDDGVLFLIAMQDRKLRIEVGQGLEGDLTDVESKRIIDDRVVPFFRAGRPSDGIVVGVRSILEKTAPEYLKELGDAPAAPQRTKKKRSSGIPFPIFIIGLFIFLFLSRGGRRAGLLGAIAASTLGSGRGGYGGRGGGSSWGGGGGGFSGGGASGGW